jgi:very-short-patch-repair endonuclease
MKKAKKLSVGEETLALHLLSEKIAFQREFRFHPTRKWRFDFALDNSMAVEVEGGTWVNGGHSRGSIYEENCRKYNAAASLGWKVLRFTTGMVKSGEAIKTIKQAREAV